MANLLDATGTNVLDFLNSVEMALDGGAPAATIEAALAALAAKLS